MRESKTTVPRAQRVLLSVPTPRADVFDLAGVLIKIDGHLVTLGDYWVAVRMQAASARLDRGVGAQPLRATPYPHTGNVCLIGNRPAVPSSASPSHTHLMTDFHLCRLGGTP